MTDMKTIVQNTQPIVSSLTKKRHIEIHGFHLLFIFVPYIYPYTTICQGDFNGPKTSKPGIGVCQKAQEVLSIRICDNYIHCILFTRAKHECGRGKPDKFVDQPQHVGFDGKPGDDE
jgi:hypothetical protein